MMFLWGKKTEMAEELHDTINPFTNEIISHKLPEEFPDSWGRTITAEEKEENRKKSMNRTKQKIFSYARCVNWEYFITMTFDKAKVDRYDYQECSKKTRAWLNNQRKRYANDLKYLVVPEQHIDGAWHFHALFADTGNMVFTDSGHKTASEKVIYNMDKWNYGFTTATEIEDTHKVAKYVGKYITKDMCKATDGKQRYFVSQNIPEPQVSMFLIGTDENERDFVETIGNSLGCEIVHCNKTNNNDYVGVTYYELR